mgnify:CR=1 FL=1
MPHITLSKKVSEEFKISRKRAEEIIKDGQICINNSEEIRPYIKVLDTQIITVKKNISKSSRRIWINKQIRNDKSDTSTRKKQSTNNHSDHNDHRRLRCLLARRPDHFTNFSARAFDHCPSSRTTPSGYRN